jgi:hypothetical protein
MVTLFPPDDGYMIKDRLPAILSPNPTATHENAGEVKNMETSLELFAIFNENCVSVFSIYKVEATGASARASAARNVQSVSEKETTKRFNMIWQSASARA